jgi:hypothetical protein
VTTSEPATSDAATADPAAVVPSRPDSLTAATARPEAAAADSARLRTALVRLAREDAEAAGRILAGLLPAQAAILDRATDYDLTIREAGTYAVTIADGDSSVTPLDKPRGRRGAEFHISGDALSLASLLAGADIKPRRFSGPVRVKGRRRRATPVVKAVVASRLSLAEAVKAGADLHPEQLIPAIAHAIDSAWTRGHAFTIEYRIQDGSTFFLIARDAGGLAVTRSAPENPPDATVVTTSAGFQHLLRDEPAPPGERPSVRGDRMAVALLKRWLDAAR